jgi:hypothetical protein
VLSNDFINLSIIFFIIFYGIICHNIIKNDEKNYKLSGPMVENEKNKNGPV